VLARTPFGDAADDPATEPKPIDLNGGARIVRGDGQPRSSAAVRRRIGTVTRTPSGCDVESPVQAEVFVVWLNDGRLELTGPCGAAPWLLELGATDHPVEVVDRIVRDVVGRPLLVHSTSWRRDRDAVILSFVVAIESGLVGDMGSAPIGRSALARSEATAAPASIATAQVVEHGLRHLAWLAQDDPVVREELAPAWRSALAAYVPEPFRNLG
jgi:hypothetical protein